MMLTESTAYANRWRPVAAEAKVTFAALALVAAFIAPPAVALGLAAGLAAVTVLAARVPLRTYRRAAFVPVSFLLASAATLAVSVRPSAGALPPAVVVDAAQAHAALGVLARSAAVLSAMLLLALTTPMTDLIALARRLRVPATLVELMSVCYRSVAVLAEALSDMRRARAARLGHTSWRRTLASLGEMTALLAVETWRRSIVMHQASVARCGGGELRFLEPEREGVARQLTLGALAGVVLVSVAVLSRGGVL